MDNAQNGYSSVDNTGKIKKKTSNLCERSCGDEKLKQDDCTW